MSVGPQPWVQGEACAGAPVAQDRRGGPALSQAFYCEAPDALSAAWRERMPATGGVW